MIDIHYKKKIITIPGEWAELTGKQYLRVIKELHKNITNEWFAADAMLRVLTNKSFFSFYLLPADMRWRCYDKMKWVYEDQNCTEQLLPKYKTLYGPAGDFMNLLMAEFHHTEIAYQQYILNKGENAEALNILVAVLYRRGKNKKLYNYKLNSEGDYRVPFNAAEIEWHLKKVSNWPQHVKQAVFTWYDACRQQLLKQYAAAFTGSTKKGSYAQGLFEMMRSISGTKYGSFKEVEQMPVRTAFLEIIASKHEAAEMERAYNKKTG
jgi:hypothetical protein